MQIYTKKVFLTNPMVMGTEIRDMLHTMKEFRSGDIFPNHISMNPNQPFLDILNGGTNLDALGASPDEDSHDDAFSDLALTYISQMLMDEDDRVDNFHEYADIRATEKPFYDILGQKYPPSPIQPPVESSYSTSTSSSSGGGVDAISIYDFSSQHSFGSVNGGFGTELESREEDYLYGLSDLFRESEPAAAWQFRRGEEEARKFLPSEDKLVIDLEADGYSLPLIPKEEIILPEVKSEKEDREYASYRSRGRKNPHGDDMEEGRSTKHSAVSFEEATLRSDMSDDPLLCHGDKFSKVISDLREAYHIGPSGGKVRGKKQRKKEVVDLRTILIQCAQMVAADDRRGTSELLKQIRQNSSPIGDGSQRLAHYFANGLDARLAGTGSEIYNLIKQKRRTATDYLKAYQLYLAFCPFKKVSYYFSNQHILDITENATRVHVVDYGIGFGFQWPSLIQRMSFRTNGAPKLRITGIDLPQPGFRPRERLDETGRRLADYAAHFKVPFEYRGISSRWEDVSIEDLHIDKDEVLVVNCLYMLRHVADETVAVECPRNTVLNTIRKMNPDIFIHGIINGSYSAPFFVTRFREALFFFSAIYDMLETNVPREDEVRQLIEREIFGREIMNIIACEGMERVERPETYKQWQVRNLRAGFVQRPLSRDMCKKAKDKVKECYHKDFIIDEDGRWLIQGWKGRILVALSSWKPSSSS